MKIRYTVTLAAIAGFGLGAVAIEGLHAQAKPPVYYIAEVDVTNPEAYAKEYVPRAVAATKAASGRILALGGKVTVLDGQPPKARVVVQVWDSIEKIQAWRNSKDFKEARKIGQKYATFRAYAVEGIPQK
jgi:uncharacterized protein (DUF1330 family)